MKPPFFGAFDALAVDDTKARRRVSTCEFSGHRVEGVVHAREHAIAVPADEVVVHDALGGKILRQLAPLAPGRQHVEDRVQHHARFWNRMTPRLPRGRHQRRDECLLLIGQVARISAVLAFISRSAIVSPHPAPPTNYAHGATESQVIPRIQEV